MRGVERNNKNTSGIHVKNQISIHTKKHTMKKTKDRTKTPHEIMMKVVKCATRRRLVFFTLTFLLTAFATLLMMDLYWRMGYNFPTIINTILFFILFWQISFGAMHTLFGLFSRPRKRIFDHITQTIADDKEDIPLGSTAILMPCYNEETKRVYEGIRTIYKSIEKTGQIEHFDFFILSDSTNPDRWVPEEAFWLELCQQLNAFGRIHYRRRENNFHKKAGNVADFLRSWGKRYRYMLCLDADSIMSGECIVNLGKIMEKNPNVGICQTAPIIVRGETLYARMMQFASNFYGSVFQTGLNYWQQEGGNFWGHNAILRIEPFMEYCALPKLPGKEPFGGKILSHDFVEAALMRKAGWFVWLAYDQSGSWEEGPPDLIESAKRDRRWCQGNLQHTWLVLSKGLFPTNRIHMINGIMSYASSLIWLMFLLVTSFIIYRQSVSGLSMLTVPSMIDFLNVSVNQEGFIIFFITIGVLFTPKICCVLRKIFSKQEAINFGGRLNIILSVFVETVLSALIAPVLMIFNSKFVIFTLLGKGVSWGTQNRSSGDGIAFSTAVRTHWFQTLLGLVWAYYAYRSGSAFFWWLSPIFISLILSIPVSILLSKTSAGDFFKKMGIFLIPSDVNPPEELSFIKSNLAKDRFTYPKGEAYRNNSGILNLIADPYINALHTMLRYEKNSELEKLDPNSIPDYANKLLQDGVDSLSALELQRVVDNPILLRWLHEQVWLRPADKLHKSWQKIVFKNIKTV